jgi:hypothetical protein
LALQRIGDGVGAVVHAKLGQDGLYMVANGFGADMQLGCDLTVAAPGGRQVEDLALAAGQRVGSDSLSARRVRGTRSRSAARPRLGGGQGVTPASGHSQTGIQLADEPGQHRGFADAGLPAQQHHFPGAAPRHPASQHAQLRQRRVALQQAIPQGWPPSSPRAYGTVSQKTGQLPHELSSPAGAHLYERAGGPTRLQQTHFRDMMQL